MEVLRKPYIIFFGLAILLSLYFLLSDNEQDESSLDKSSSTSSVTDRNGVGNPSQDEVASNTATRSIFESEFFKSGAQINPYQDGEGVAGEGDPDILDPASKDNPVNPQTGQPYSNSVMNQFSELRDKFPNNSIIPRVKTPEDKAAEVEIRNSMQALQQSITQGTASADEVKQFYEYKMKPVSDRLELLNYVMNKTESSMSDEVKKQYEKILKSNQQSLEKYKKQESEALGKIGVTPGS